MAEVGALNFYSTKCDFSSDQLKILSKQGQAGSIQNDLLAKGKWILCFRFSLLKCLKTQCYWTYCSRINCMVSGVQRVLVCRIVAQSHLSQGRASFPGSAHGTVHAWPQPTPPCSTFGFSTYWTGQLPSQLWFPHPIRRFWLRTGGSYWQTATKAKSLYVV